MAAFSKQWKRTSLPFDHALCSYTNSMMLTWCGCLLLMMGSWMLYVSFITCRFLLFSGFDKLWICRISFTCNMHQVEISCLFKLTTIGMKCISQLDFCSLMILFAYRLAWPHAMFVRLSLYPFQSCTRSSLITLHLMCNRYAFLTCWPGVGPVICLMSAPSLVSVILPGRPARRSYVVSKTGPPPPRWVALRGSVCTSLLMWFSTYSAFT